MSLCVTIYIPSGVVMASDSRATMSITNTYDNIITRENHFFDGAQKIFELPNGFVLSWSGEAIIENEPIDMLIRRFSFEKKLRNLADIRKPENIEKTEQSILDFFCPLIKSNSTEVILAAYPDKTHQTRIITRINLGTQKIERFSPDDIGMTFTGVSDYITKLLYPCKIEVNGKDVLFDMPNVPLNLMTINDCAEFARFCINLTSRTMHFLPVVESVGGPVDILLLTPDGNKWYRRKA